MYGHLSIKLVPKQDFIVTIVVKPYYYTQVHIILSKVGQTPKSIDLDGDWSSEDNATDISDTDEDEWDTAISEV